MTADTKVIQDAARTARELTANDSWLVQAGLMAQEKFAKFAAERTGGGLKATDIVALWRQGLLRADLITSSVKLRHKRLKSCGHQAFTHVGDHVAYMDNAVVPLRKGGWRGALEKKGSTRAHLFFHPFRLYVVHALFRRVKASPVPLQYLMSRTGLEKVAKVYRDLIDGDTCTSAFADALEAANGIAEICIAAEPVSYDSVFRAIKSRHPDTAETVRDRIGERRKQMGALLQSIGLETIDEWRATLVREAQSIDGNRDVHVLLQMMRGARRLQVVGAVGRSLLLITMAECLRRAAEESLDATLKEEDEMGFGVWMSDARRKYYGTDRVFDESAIALRNVLHQQGVDYGTRVRCYVEGATELGALKYFIPTYGQIDVSDLRGRVIEKGSKGIALRDTLRANTREQVFSFLLIDGDRSDNVSAVRAAANDNDFVGAFFVFSPDFEFSNFVVEELLDVACSMKAIVLTSQERADALVKLRPCSSGKSFFATLRMVSNKFLGLSKNEAWGAALMAYAVDHPVLGSADRPIVTAVGYVARAPQVNFTVQQTEFSVDPASGMPRRRLS